MNGASKTEQALPVADAETKALYVAHFGNEEGWLGAPGSWFIEGVRAARAALTQRQQGGVGQWRPIKTAPREGSFLGLDEFGAEVWAAKQYWLSVEDGASASMPTKEAKALTHWAPLPPAPDTAAPPAQPQSEPLKGWKLVPVEPTAKMEEVGKAVGEFHRGSDASDVYRAMLAAAPARPPERPAQQQATCTRSHPHEDMSQACEALTIKARADNAAAQQEPFCECSAKGLPGCSQFEVCDAAGCAPPAQQEAVASSDRWPHCTTCDQEFFPFCARGDCPGSAALGKAATPPRPVEPMQASRCALLLGTLLQYAKHPATPNAPRWVSIMVPDDFLAEAEAALADDLAKDPAPR